MFNEIAKADINKNSTAERKKVYFNFIEVLPIIALLIAITLHLTIPNKQSFTTTKYYPTLLVAFIIIYFISLVLSSRVKRIFDILVNKAPLLTVAVTLIELWDIVTLKFKLLPLPYFPGPDKVLSTLISDWSILGISTLYSLRLLFTGYLIGAILGLITGISTGWNQRVNYWIGPLQKIIGPIPATAWIPIALTIFPTSFWASVFIIVLGVWFPVTVMTSSGIANVQNSFFEVAKTLGANKRYLIFKVAIPAAFPTIFIGLFMGLGTSFLTLIVSEMLGVKAGLGWYINWAQGWADYSKVYASLIVIGVIFSSIITLLFKIKDRVLVWQRGLIKW